MNTSTETPLFSTANIPANFDKKQAAALDKAKTSLTEARKTTLSLHGRVESARKIAADSIKKLDAADVTAKDEAYAIVETFELTVDHVNSRKEISQTSTTTYELCNALLNAGTALACVVDLLRMSDCSIIHDLVTFGNTCLDVEQRRVFFAEYKRAYAAIRKAYSDYAVVPNFYVLSDDGTKYRYHVIEWKNEQLQTKETTTKPFTENRLVSQPAEAFLQAVEWAKLAREHLSIRRLGNWLVDAEAMQQGGLIHAKSSERMKELQARLVKAVIEQYDSLIEADVKNITGLNRIRLEQVTDMLPKSSFVNDETIEAELAARRLELGMDKPPSMFENDVESWLDRFDNPAFDMKALQTALAQYKATHKQAA